MLEKIINLLHLQTFANAIKQYMQNIENKVPVNVSQLTNDAGYKTENDVKAIVTQEIDEFAQKVTNNNVIDTFKELVDYVAEHAPEAAEMASDIGELQTLVGESSVANQIIAALNTALKIDGADKYALATALTAAVESISAAEKEIDTAQTDISAAQKDIAALKESIGGASGIRYGTCPTSGSTAAKVATLDNDDGFKLEKGVAVLIKMTSYNSASSPTLNVNGTGAIAIKRYGTTAAGGSYSTSWESNSVVMFTYDGTYWMITGWVDQATPLPNALGFAYRTCTTDEATTDKQLSSNISGLMPGSIVVVQFTNAVPANARMSGSSTTTYRSIYHRGEAIKAGVINAGDTATFMYNNSNYHLLSVDYEVADEVQF